MKRTGFSLALAAGALIAAPAFAFGGGSDMGTGGPGMMGGPEALFDQADANGDGKVTKEEAEALKAARIAGLDADGDGFVTAEEMAAQMMARMQDQMTKMARHRIVDLDTDGDGKVSMAEFAVEDRMARIFDRLDGDGDGAVSREELQAMRDKRGDRRGEGRGWFGRGGHDHGWGDGDGPHGMPFWPWGDDGRE